MTLIVPLLICVGMHTEKLKKNKVGRAKREIEGGREGAMGGGRKKKTASFLYSLSTCFVEDHPKSIRATEINKTSVSTLKRNNF